MWSALRAGRFTPGKDPVPIVQETGWAPEPVWIGAENLAPPGFDPWTFQPAASRYTDCAITAPAETYVKLITGVFRHETMKEINTRVTLFYGLNTLIFSYLAQFVQLSVSSDL